MNKMMMTLGALLLLAGRCDAAGRLSLETSADYSGVRGDDQKFREHFQIGERWTGGLKRFSLANEWAGFQVEADGRAAFQRDLGLDLGLKRGDAAYLKVKLDADRRFYDSSSFYYFNRANVTNPATELDKNLRTDRDSFGVEFGASLPSKTRLSFSAEHGNRKGYENLFWGGWIRDGAANNWILWTNPLERRVDYKLDRLSLAVRQPVGRFEAALRQDVERSYGNAFHMEPGYRIDQAVKVFDRLYSSDVNTTVMNTTVGFEGDLVPDKLNLDAEYRFSRSESRTTYDADTFDPTGARVYNEHSFSFMGNSHSGHRYRHTAQASLALTAWDHIASPFVSLRADNGMASNLSVRREDGSNGVNADANPNTLDEIWEYRTRNRENSWAASAGAVISAIPRTKVNLRFDNEYDKVAYDWTADFQRYWFGGGNNSSTLGDWYWDADTIYERRRYTAALRTSPAGWLRGRVRFRSTDQLTRARTRSRYIENKLGDPEYGWPAGAPRTDLYYPGRIGSWRKPTQEFSMSADISPCAHVTLRPHLDLARTEYKVENDDNPELPQDIAEFRSRAYGGRVDLLPPVPGLGLSLGFAKRDAVTKTMAADRSRSIGRNPMTGAADGSYFGGIIGGSGSDAVILDAQVNYDIRPWGFTVTAGRTKDHGNIDSLQWSSGAGVEYRISDDFSARVQGSFYDYSETYNGGINNYKVHMVALGLNARFNAGQ